jgi:hypothetical protein
VDRVGEAIWDPVWNHTASRQPIYSVTIGSEARRIVALAVSNPLAKAVGREVKERNIVNIDRTCCRASRRFADRRNHGSIREKICGPRAGAHGYWLPSGEVFLDGIREDVQILTRVGN